MRSKSVVRYSEKGNTTLTEKDVFESLVDEWLSDPVYMEPLLQKSKTYKAKRFKITLIVEEVQV